MTPTRYYAARFAQAFGYFRRAQRMADAASEMHLLREAEAFLGAAIWEKVEGIEALSVEYWNLRKLIKEREEVRSKLAECQERLDRAHQERAELLNSTPEENKELLDERATLLAGLEQLAQNYLGSADRAYEIYEENRHLLPGPNLLPIGAELAIPVTASETNTQPSASPTFAPDADGLVPLERPRSGEPPRIH